ncbi:disulfide bond formation protein DsbA [Candidatus Peregrinibacteria bacterium CG10_big_fil_rev_8_21_14_0_10_49_10]|nr:MAG: disulfide bond formation protein DsbA [Candidatus Peregrinibacteria bacterium CG10_big_fil_rev_8_21_14_0_10_49_10]
MPNLTTNGSNPWFGVSMALIGVIIGYSVALGTADSQPGKPAGAAAPSPSVAAQPTAPAPQAPSAANIVAPDPKTDHIRGNPKATVSLIEYSDFECPFCQRHHPTLQQALDEYGDDVNWVYRHYPLSFHPNARPSALASECVAELGGNDAFWQFADTVFEKGAVVANLQSYAGGIGINTTAFSDCLSSEKYAEHVDGQLDEGSASGVSGTPGTIVYNNETKESRYISGAQPYSNIKAAIDAIL